MDSDQTESTDGEHFLLKVYNYTMLGVHVRFIEAVKLSQL